MSSQNTPSTILPSASHKLPLAAIAIPSFISWPASRQRLAGFGLVLLLSLGLLAVPRPMRADYTATPVPTTTLGVWQGWGTALAWMGHSFGNQAGVADVMFSTANTTFNGTTYPGLGLNVARYNLGACGTGSVNGQSMVIENIPPYAQMQGYWLNPTSTNPSSSSWNWSLDANQRQMLQNAKALGADNFELFSNSPMWWMCQNFNPAGASNPSNDNLNSAYTTDFAIYLATVAKYAQTNWGITFNKVEAFNEPTSPFWQASFVQEGCHFADTTQVGVISALRSQLNSQGLTSMPIAASDENQVDLAVTTWNSFNSTTQSQVGVITTHGYEGENGNATGLHSLAVAGGKYLHMNEYGDNDQTGMSMARYISYAINTLQATEWNYWQIFDGGTKDPGWGMIEADPAAVTIGAACPKYYVMAQYSRHIREGMTIINSGDANTVAAIDPVTNTLILVTANQGTAQTITYNLSNFANVAGPVTHWVTVTNAPGIENYVNAGTIPLSGKSFSSTFAVYSVQTFNIPLGGSSGLPNGTYKMIAANSGLALDVVGQATANSSPVDQYTYNGGSNQAWTVTALSGNNYKIIGVQSGRALEIPGSSTTNGTVADIYDWNSGSNQEWTITSVGSGNYSVINVNSGKALEIFGGVSEITPGAPVDQWSYGGQSNQQWSFQAPSGIQGTQINFDVPGGASGFTNYSGQGAAADSGNNFWNAIVPNGTTSSCKLDNGTTTSPITLTVSSDSVYTSGGQGTQGTPSGLQSPFYDSKPGPKTCTLANIPAGTYNLYLYGINGDNTSTDCDRGTTFTVGSSSLSTVNTTAAYNTFIQGNDYVVFPNIVVGSGGGSIVFTYKANGSVLIGGVANTIGNFNGLQLVPQ